MSTIRRPVLAVLLVCLAALSPSLFLGKIPAETDLYLEYGPWASIPYKGHPITAGGDSFRAHLPDRLSVLNEWKAGRLPLWNPHVSGGVPFLGLQTANPLDPLILLHVLLPTGLALGVNYALLLFLAGFGMVLFLRETGVRAPPALAFGGVAFLLNPYFLYWLELRVFVAGLATLPLALWALEKVCQGSGNHRHAAVMALSVAYAAVAGTLQTVVLFLAVLVLRLIWNAALSGKSWRAGVPSLAILLGLMVGILPLISSWELLMHSTRGGEGGYYAENNFLSWRVLALWFSPDVFGWPSLKVDETLPVFERSIASSSGWGALGILPLGLAGLGLLRKVGPGRERVFWGGLAGFALVLLLVMGSPLGELVRRLWPTVDHIDLLRGLFVVNLGGAILAAWGAEELIRLWKENTGKVRWVGPVWMLLALGITSVITGRMGMAAPNPLIHDLLPLFLVVGTVLLVGLAPGRGSWKAWGLILIVAVELGYIHFRFNAFSHPDSDYPHRPLIDEMRSRLDAPDHSRFFAPGEIRVFPPNTGSIFGLSDIRGYSNLPVSRFRLLLECAEGREMTNQVQLQQLESPIYRMLAGNYLLVYFPSELKTPLYERVESSEYDMFRRIEPLPRAYLVHHVLEVEDEDRMRVVLTQSRFDPAVIVALEKDAGPPPAFAQPSNPETVEIVSHESDRVVIRVEADAPGMLVLADAYYPGWRATSDGSPTKVYPANWGLRGVAVEAGSHEIVFTYRPWWLLPGLVASALGLVGIGIGLVGRIRLRSGEPG